MSRNGRKRRRQRTDDPAFDLFDVEGSDPDSLYSGRIPDPQPEHTPLFRFLARVLSAAEEKLRARGGKPLRVAIRVFWGVVSAIGILLLIGPVINKPLDIDDILASADLDEVDWVARDVAIDYTVDRADDGAFSAQIGEQYTADFRNGPESFVERTIVTEFEGHDAQFALHSATVDGEEVDATVVRKATTTVVRLQPADGAKFEGQRRIEIAYELQHLITTKPDEATGRAVDQWDWSLFAPTWPQATKGLEASFSLSREVDDALVRAPRAYVGWLLVSGTERLTPDEDQPNPDRVVYSFSNDDSLPPNADIWIHASFQPGTFAQPPKTPLFWVQTYGPLVPLALLAVFLLFAIAARRIVWADTAGEPWYVARSTPPEGLSLDLATRLLNKPQHAELLDTLNTQNSSPAKDRGNLAALARAGRRAGRLGNELSTLHWATRWSKDDRVVKRKLRWVPDSYVRDSLIFAPLAITLVQWGLLRQLSHQVILSVVWWPAAFVLASTTLALAAVAILYRPRPLTREGALAVQQLKGIDVYAEATRLLDRGTVDDPLLGYAMLFESPRRAGRAVEEMAIAETGDRHIARGWRTERFLSVPVLASLAGAVAILVTSIVAVSVLPAPYAHDPSKLTEHGDLPGTIYTQAQGFEIEARIDMTEARTARVEVTEHHSVEFDASGARVPQFAREWPSARMGQDLGFELEAVRIDGEPVPHREISNTETQSIAMLTEFEDALIGVHDVEVEYALTSPVVDAVHDGRQVQELRWVGQYDFWDHEYYTNITNAFDGRAPVRPIRVQVTIAPEVVDEVADGGWIDFDFDEDRVPHERGNTFRPWSFENQYVSDSDDELHDLTVGSASSAEDGSLVAVIDFDDMGAQPGDAVGKYETGLTSDLGVRLDFDSGTFAGVDPEAYEAYALGQRLPFIVLMSLGAAVFGAAASLFVYALRTRQRRNASLAAVSYFAIPLAAVAHSVVFFWTIGPMAGSDGRIPGALVLGGVMWVATIAQVIMVTRRITPPAQAVPARRARRNSG